MTEDKDPKSPATTSLAYDCMLPFWRKVGTVLGGTEAMRAAGKELVPQHEEESDLAYADRLNSAVLFNVTELTLGTWVGKPFSEPLKVQDDVPEALSVHFEDVDLQGNNMDVFARRWFRDG